MVGKDYLYKAFENLTLEYNLSDISVKKLVEAAGVNRNTFYYHFNDMNEFMRYYFIETVTNNLLGDIKEVNLLKAYAFLCDYVKTHQVLLMKMLEIDTYSSLLLEVLHNALQKELIEVIHKYEKILKVSFNNDLLFYISEILTTEYTSIVMRICFLKIDPELLKKVFEVYCDTIPDMLRGLAIIK